MISGRFLPRPGSLVPLLLVGAPVALASAYAEGQADDRNDARCAWGRLSDGKGALVRCISKEEAAWLMLKTPLAAAPDAGAARSPEPPSPPRDTADAGREKGDGASPVPPSEPAEPRAAIEVVRVDADEGTIPGALEKLRVPKDRYLECLERHGGLFRSDGELHIRFLVRQRGRAEGVHVVRRRSVSEAAGKCIADVVDRRRVGAPTAEMAGATVVFTFSRLDE
jgi:hypothetical protein